ncbi:hypothetical protein L6R52_21565 [Myxococcota bacterium]|nr:hypothetical protein [Myxococcota bacterium]
MSRDTLEATPGRLLDLLKGIGTRPAIRAALARVGYTAEEHQRAWNLLFACSGFAPANDEAEVDRDVVDAINELDQQDERTAQIIEATLKHRAPAVLAKVLEGLTPGTGADSVLFFSQLVPRLDALARGELAGVPEDQQEVANAALEQRRIDAEARARFRTLVATAQGAKANVEPRTKVDREALDAALRAARAFYEEWSTIARTEIKRRDHLISLGLATRRTRSTSDAETDAPAAPLAPPPAPGAAPDPV